MKVRVNEKTYEYNRERYLEGVVREFPIPKRKTGKKIVVDGKEQEEEINYDPFGFRNYPHDEKEFTTPFVKLFQVPEGYQVAWKIGGAVRGQRPVRGAGYHLMVGLGGLLQSAHVIGIKNRQQDLIVEHVVTRDGVSLSSVDARLVYRVTAPEKTLGVGDYRAITFGAAIGKIADHVGDKTLVALLSETGIETNLALGYSFPQVEEVGVEMLNLFLVDVPLDEGSKRTIEQEAIGRAEYARRKLNAEARAYEIVQRGEAIATVGQKLQGNPGAIYLQSLETYDEFARGPNNTIITVPEIKLNVENIRRKAEERS